MSDYTYGELDSLGFDDLVDLCYAQHKKLDEARGYDSGLRRNHLSIFDRATLINCYLEVQDIFKGT